MKPLKLTPIMKSSLWGGKRLYETYAKGDGCGIVSESWEASCHPDGESLLPDKTTLSEYIRAHPEALGTDRCSDEFPVIVKFIDAHERLSLQVHPDDETARRLEKDGVGKTEMWYVVDADEGSQIYCGIKDGVGLDEIKNAMADNTLSEKLKVFDSKKGDVFFIEAGTVHAIGKGNLILEVQQSSNITYRLYDWDRIGADGKKRELHIDKGLMSVKPLPTKKCEGSSTEDIRTLAQSKYFTVSELSLNGTRHLDINKKSYIIATLVSGSALIGGEGFNAGDSVFVPAGYGDLILKGEAKIIMTQNTKRYFVGIDLGGTNIATAVVDSQGAILGRAKKKTNAPRPYNEICDDMAECALECVKAAGLDFSQIESVGVGTPGSVDKEKGEVEFANNLGFRNAPLVSYLEGKLGKKVFIENDANAAAWGEYIAGSGKDVKSLVMITLGTGVGGGIIENGRLITGAYGKGAELGHTVIVAGGEPCNCGRRGCLECYTSATALIRQTKKAMMENPDSELWKVVDGDINAVSGKTPFIAKDEVAKKVVATYLDYLGEGVLDVMNLLQPEIIAIGGGISHEGEAILNPIKEKINREAYNRFGDNETKITLATLGNDAGIIGAALLGLN